MKKKILLISDAPVGAKMAGPAIRYWNFSKELSKKFNVTLLIPNNFEYFGEEFNFNIFTVNKKYLKKNLKNFDVVILQGLTTFRYPYIKKSNIPIVVDIYDPFILENLELRKKICMDDRIQYHQTDLRILLDQLSWGDYFICASEKQKDFWLGMLAANNRINPINYDKDKTSDKLIGVVPFGINNTDPIKNKKVIKGVISGIEESDKVIIWGGGLWEWFDPITLIKAMNLICKKRNDIKLFFLGTGKPSNSQNTNIADECIKLSKEYQLFDKNIFFNEWVEYSERHNYLLEADLGVTTYFNNLETRFSFRTRLLDYLWCELPMVVSKGDYIAELIDSNQLGITCSEEDYNELASSILKLLENKEEYLVVKQNIARFKNKFKWENVVTPLQSYCDNPKVTDDKVKKIKVLYKRDKILILKYYFIRCKTKVKNMFNS